MLVLSRNVEESLSFETSDGTINLIVLSARGNKVKLGLSAPAKVKILRSEIVKDKAALLSLDDAPLTLLAFQPAPDGSFAIA